MDSHTVFFAIVGLGAVLVIRMGIRWALALSHANVLTQNLRMVDQQTEQRRQQLANWQRPAVKGIHGQRPPLPKRLTSDRMLVSCEGCQGGMFISIDHVGAVLCAACANPNRRHTILPMVRRRQAQERLH